MKLPNIRIVLVNTSHPGNIGAVARAMKNMCLSKLVLVEPKIFPSAEATARASGADDVLASTKVVGSLVDALAGCQLVVGASARLRSIEWPQVNPSDCAQLLFSEGGNTDVAVVFGREHAGLTNTELDLCHYLVNIPANPEYSSLNLAAAVQVVAYEILVASQRELTSGAEQQDVVTVEKMDAYYQRLGQLINHCNFVDVNGSPRHHARILRRLRRLYNRARPTNEELNILHGILSAINSKMGAD